MSPPVKNQEFYAYLAGLIDADGAITIVSRKDEGREGYRIRLSYYCCNPKIIKLLAKNFGGKIVYKKYGKSKLNKNQRICYRWHLYDVSAATLIEKMFPYLVIKRRQAKYCLNLQLARGFFPNPHFRWHPDDAARFRSFARKLKGLCNYRNTKGKEHPVEWYVHRSLTKKLELAYFAGFVDGDGSIMITSQMIKRWENYKPKIAIANRNIQIIESFGKLFGGRPYLKTLNENDADRYQVEVVNDSAIQVIKQIKKYLLLKCKQADLLLELDKIKKTTLRGTYPTRIKEYNKLKTKCQLLNKRGT